MNVDIATTDSEIENCFDVMSQLRPHIRRNEFLEKLGKQRQQGYEIAYIDVEGKVVAVAGFRVADNLAWGKFLYVDDLVTGNKERSKGFGKVLLEWLLNYAKENGCDSFHLDSGITRIDAHRFYLNNGLEKSSYHYSVKL